MNIQPINDNNSRFDLVEIKTTNPRVSATPHCKIHGAMNCVAVHATGKLWRCIQSNMAKDCRAGCEQLISPEEYAVYLEAVKNWSRKKR